MQVRGVHDKTWDWEATRCLVGPQLSCSFRKFPKLQIDNIPFFGNTLTAVMPHLQIEGKAWFNGVLELALMNNQGCRTTLHDMHSASVDICTYSPEKLVHICINSCSEAAYALTHTDTVCNLTGGESALAMIFDHWFCLDFMPAVLNFRDAGFVPDSATSTHRHAELKCWIRTRCSLGVGEKLAETRKLHSKGKTDRIMTYGKSLLEATQTSLLKFPTHI